MSRGRNDFDIPICAALGGDCAEFYAHGEACLLVISEAVAVSTKFAELLTTASKGAAYHARP